MDEHEYRAFDGLGLAQLVANKETTAAELLAIAQARADRVNPRINAITNRLDGRAARQLRENLTEPYAGVPFLLADLGQDLAGTPTSAGCRALVGRAAAHTSTVVQQWLQAGLVVFGKTNTSEFGFKWSPNLSSSGLRATRGIRSAPRAAPRVGRRRPWLPGYCR